MLFIVSHFAKNKGTTDYFRDFLISEKREHYYLKHPLPFTEENYSYLLFFDGNNETILKKYRVSKNQLVSQVITPLITIFALSQSKNIRKIIAFGSYNACSAMPFKFLKKIEVIFWGVDYSTKRFHNKILNFIYSITETVASRYSTYVYSVSPRQVDVRVKSHGLNITNSVLVPNGVKSINKVPNFSKYEKIGLVYIGSVTHAHGIIDFVNFFYVDRKIDLPLYIIGDGENLAELKKLISKYKLEGSVFILGYIVADEILPTLVTLQCFLYGLAPYSDKKCDHVFYGDSLKIKEYLNYGISFIVSDVVEVPEDLKSYGYSYDSKSDLARILALINTTSRKVMSNPRSAINKYWWNRIFKDLNI